MATLDLGTVDLSPYLSPTATSEASKAVAEALVNAYKTVGFVYCLGWEACVPEDLVTKVFEYNEKVFALPTETKMAYKYTSVEANRGYLSLGREAKADQKQTWEFGNDATPEHPEQWPTEEECPGLRSVVKEFHKCCHQLEKKMMSLIAISLGLDDKYFDPLIRKGENNLRFLHYPATSRNDPSSRLGAHTDDGLITLLWQDFTGGLEVENPDGEWVAVVPKAKTVLVNVADMLQRMSNDTFKSTRHRAVVPPIPEGAEKSKDRRSVAYFCNLDRDTTIASIPGLGEPKYEPVNAGKFYAANLAVGIPDGVPVAVAVA